MQTGTTVSAADSPLKPAKPKATHTARWIAMGLVLGVLAGLFLGDYCGGLQVLGDAYVGLLQMTVLPYLVISLVSKLGRLGTQQARAIGFTALVVLLVLWLIAIVLIVLVAAILPPVEGASFYSPEQAHVADGEPDFLSRFIPTNVFRSLTNEYVPAVVVFCLFFGCALMLVPGKEPLLDFLDLCSDGIGRINVFLVRLSPLGLFALSAAAAGTMRIEELARLQGYLIMLTLACLIAAFVVLPLLLDCLTGIRYRDLLRAAQEPLLTAVATGKLFVVLPQIIDQCDRLQQEAPGPPAQPDDQRAADEHAESSASILVPLAYSFPHLGKILTFVFISFAAWYSGGRLTPIETAEMATTGAISSFASPMITIPYLLDRYQISRDLMALFILPGFITMRLGDVVGVMHLMVLTLIVNQATQGQLRIRWRRLAAASIGALVCLLVLGAASRLYLTSTTIAYHLDKQFLALEIDEPHGEVVVYTSRDDLPDRPPPGGSTLDRIKTDRVLRVGYHPDHLPSSFFNSKDHLVGLDVELIHRLAVRLQVKLEFVPYAYDTVVDQLASGEIDVAVGGLVMKPERLLRVGFTQPYQTATISIVIPDHRRSEVDTWDKIGNSRGLRLGAVHEDVSAAARRQLPNIEMVVVDSIRSYFAGEREDLDGLVMAAESAAAWNILYPRHTVVVPQPIIQRPVGMAVRLSDDQWLRFLDRWLDFERLDGSLERLRVYWVEGGGTKQRQPRWSILRNVLGWLP
jgi:Na+/H+-dicarboxylate symporter/ABC-type amino acid transport substrate-binding protein